MIALLALLQHSAQRLRVDQRAPGDTMTVFSPPLDITPFQRVIRWFFSVPQWVQIGGIVLAVLVGLVAAYAVWRQRHALVDWARTRHVQTPMRWKIVIGLAGIAVLGLLGAAGAGFFAYSQHNNQFCVSCHTLHDEVYQRFQQSRHHTVANLTCHDCHREPLIASARQVGLWIVKRPEEVGAHAPVPRVVCASCHVRGDAEASWQQVAATAGHSVHLLGDSARKAGIECLTCHGVTAHRFVPVAQTCATCHENSEIRLGKMAGQTTLHCTLCHDFGAPVDRALVPVKEECLRCHAMRERMADFSAARDPHRGRCGDCHNAHDQTEPKQAFESCTSCHTEPEKDSPFHRGVHGRSVSNCAQCHQAHTWRVRGTQCLDCHADIYNEPARPAAARSD